MTSVFAVLIDADNIPAPVIGKALTILKTRGRIVICKVFGDFSRPALAPWKQVCLTYNLEAIMAWHKSGKNSSDLKLCQACTHMLYSHPTINDYVLVTGDGDYTTVIQDLKTHDKQWFGGGMDLTPCLDDEKFRVKYHQELKKICDLYDTTWYDKFSKACDEYFYLPHRKETRGIGGLFFEYYSPEDMDFKFVERMGIKFADVMRTTAINYMNNNYTDEHKDIQKIKRGRYVEFNLLYDRGTKFGFKTGGNMEAILMSLPPDVSWP